MIEVKDKANALVIAVRNEQPMNDGILITIATAGGLRVPDGRNGDKTFYQRLDELLQEYVA